MPDQQKEPFQEEPFNSENTPDESKRDLDSLVTELRRVLADTGKNPPPPPPAEEPPAPPPPPPQEQAPLDHPSIDPFGINLSDEPPPPPPPPQQPQQPPQEPVENKTPGTDDFWKGNVMGWPSGDPNLPEPEPEAPAPPPPPPPQQEELPPAKEPDALGDMAAAQGEDPFPFPADMPAGPVTEEAKELLSKGTPDSPPTPPPEPTLPPEPPSIEPAQEKESLPDIKQILKEAENPPPLDELPFDDSSKTMDLEKTKSQPPMDSPLIPGTIEQPEPQLQDTPLSPGPEQDPDQAGVLQFAIVFPEGHDEKAKEFTEKLIKAGKRLKEPLVIQSVLSQAWSPDQIDVGAWAKSAQFQGATYLIVLAPSNSQDIFKTMDEDLAPEHMRGRSVSLEHIRLRALYAEVLWDMRRSD